MEPFCWRDVAFFPIQNPCRICLHTHLADLLYGKWVGKYTSPMDRMGGMFSLSFSESGLIFSAISDREIKFKDSLFFQVS